MTRTIQRALVSALLASTAIPASAQIAVSSNDRQQVQENGVTRPVPHAPSNTISVLDLGSSPVKLLWELDDVPGSVVGPPSTVAITPDESLALVAASTQIDPGDNKKTIPDTRLTVIDLKQRKVTQRLQTGAGAAGISITRDGKRAYLASRQAGMVHSFAIENGKVRPIGEVKIGPPEALVSHIALSRDGKTGVVTHQGAHKISIVRIDGDTMTVTGEFSSAGQRPYAAAVHPNGKVALVANLGEGKGDAGTIVLVDLASGKLIGAPVSVGFEALEGMQMSDDGVWVAAVTHAGSTKPKDSPLFKDHGMVVLLRFDAAKNTLTKVADAKIGRWSQGAAFSKDGKTLLVQNMIENDIQVFRIDNGKLADTGQRIKVKGGAAAIRTSSGL